MEENKIVEVTTEDKIAKLKTTLEQMELLGESIPEIAKEAVKQELAVLEAKALEELQKVEENASDFWDKNRNAIIIVAVLLVLHVAGLFGL